MNLILFSSFDGILYITSAKEKYKKSYFIIILTVCIVVSFVIIFGSLILCIIFGKKKNQMIVKCQVKIIYFQKIHQVLQFK